jgi:outer membrane protein TolC
MRKSAPTVFTGTLALALVLSLGSAAPAQQIGQPDAARSGKISSPHGSMRAITSHIFDTIETGQAAPEQTKVDPSSASQAPMQLSFQHAVELAVENNINSLIARERIREARGRAIESRSGLLPNLNATASQIDETTNLAALGFDPASFPGIRSLLLGPFKNFDARIRLVQSIFNVNAIRRAQAAGVDVDIARLEEQLTRQEVATQTALAYLNALSSARAVEAAQANLSMAQSLLTLARNQHDAGIATGVDVTRAETRLAEQRVRLAQAQTNADQARLLLLRIIRLPLSTAITLTDSLQFTSEPSPALEQTVTEAQQNRLEVRIASEQIKLSAYNRKAAEAEQLPSLEFIGDYGESGNTPKENALPTRTFGVRLNIPVFNGGATRGRIAAAGSRERQAELLLNDTLSQVEQDVRNAIQTLATAAEQVRAAQQTVELAERELQMSRDRFAAGVANNIEVINAQTSLANARDEEVTALAAYNAARINLAAARGRVESFRW